MPIILPRVSALGNYTAPIAGAVARTVAGRLAEMVSVKDFGAKGDNATDDAPAIQAAIDSARPLWVPSGTYRLQSSLKIRGAGLQMIGANGRQAAGGTAELFDARAAPGAEPLIRREQGWMQADGTFTNGEGGTPSFANSALIRLENLRIRATQGEQGSAAQIDNCRGAYIANCEFNFSMRGLTFGNSTFDYTVMNCWFNGGRQWHRSAPDTALSDADKEEALRSWALYSVGHAYLHGINVQGSGTGVWLAGNSANLFGCRIETAGFGIVLGRGRYTTSNNGLEPYMLQRSIVCGASFEACAVGMLVDTVNSTTITGIGGQGSPVTTGRTHDSETGLEIGSGVGTARIDNIIIGGQYTRAAIVNNSNRALWNVGANNGRKIESDDATNDQNKPIYGGQLRPFSGAHQLIATPITRTNKTVTAFDDLMVRGLTGTNVHDDRVFSKQLGGVQAVTAEATTAAVAFFGGAEANNFAFNAGDIPRAIADAESLLSAGTYWYATTVVDKRGETAVNANTERSVTVTAGQAVELNWFGSAAPGRLRRLYRGPRQGFYHGFWELPVAGAFVDDGTRPFDGHSLPSQSGGLNSLHEDDANYEIIATPSWATTVHVTDKATTGFTLNFGTAAPEGATCAWLMFRP